MFFRTRHFGDVAATSTVAAGPWFAAATLPTDEVQA